MRLAVILTYVCFVITVSSIGNEIKTDNDNDNELKNEINMEDDFIMENMQDVLSASNSPLLLNQGYEKLSNERNCYCSMLFTDDSGKIPLNQLCVPGGKKAKLSKENRQELLKYGLKVGHEKDNFVVCVENSSWWGDIGLRMLKTYPSLNCTDGLMYILIVDHLTKHQGSVFVTTLENIRKCVAFGAATHTHNVQINDLGINGVCDYCVKSYSNRFVLKFGKGKVPSWAQLCFLHYKLTQVINNSPKYQSMIRGHYTVGGYTLSIDNDEKDEKFLDGLQFKPPKAYLNQFFNEDIIKATEQYGSPWHAPASVIKKLKLKTGSKTAPPGHIKWNPSKPEIRELMSEFEKAQAGKVVFGIEDKKCWLNGRRKQVKIYHKVLIEDNPKYNKLNAQGLIENRGDISADARQLIAANKAQKEKIRKEKLGEYAKKFMEEEKNGTKEYVEGGDDLSHVFWSIASRQKYLSKTFQAKGIWSSKKMGNVNRSKRNLVNTQPLIEEAFAIVQLNVQKKLIEQQKRKLYTDMNDTRKRKSNKKRTRPRSSSTPPKPKPIPINKSINSDKKEMSDSDDDQNIVGRNVNVNKNKSSKRSHSTPPRKKRKLTGVWASLLTGKSNKKGKQKKKKKKK
eukprot:502551_1